VLPILEPAHKERTLRVAEAVNQGPRGTAEIALIDNYVDELLESFRYVAGIVDQDEGDTRQQSFHFRDCAGFRSDN
jgi:hypothetical protein